jgi:hypothetical protein
MKVDPKVRNPIGYRFPEHPVAEMPESRLYRLYWQLRKGNVLYFMSAGAQLFAGLTLLGVAVTGNIPLMWLATAVSAAGTLVCITGAYLLYDLLRNRNSVEFLVKDSINRAITNLN